MHVKPSPKAVGKKTTSKKIDLSAPVKKSSMTTARLSTNHNETLVQI